MKFPAEKRPPAPSSLECDYQRSRLLIGNKELAMIVIASPLEFVFDGRPRCDPARGICPTKRPCLYHKLEREQMRFHELRIRFLTTQSAATMQNLARWLPRFYTLLRRAATGYRDPSGGDVRRFAECPHGRSIDETCERCAAEDAECSAL